MKPSVGQLLCFFLLALTIPAFSQSVRRPSFRAIVHLKEGGQIRGVMDDIQNGVLEFVPYEKLSLRHVQIASASVDLAQVESVVIKRTDKRQAVRTGLIVGSLLGGYLAIRSNQRNNYRSPVLGVFAIALSAGSLGAAGAITGSLIGGASRRVIRPIDRDHPVESLERQLRPFTKTYLDNVQLDVQ